MDIRNMTKDQIIDAVGNIAGMATATAVIQTAVVKSAARGPVKIIGSVGAILLGLRCGKIAAEELRELLTKVDDSGIVNSANEKIHEVVNFAEKKDEPKPEDGEA